MTVPTPMSSTALCTLLIMLAVTAQGADSHLENITPPPLLTGPPATKGPKPIFTLEDCVTRALRNSHRIAAERHRLTALTDHRNSRIWEVFSNFFIRGDFALVPGSCTEMNTSGGLQNCQGGPVAAETDYDTSWGPSIHLRIGGAIPIPTSRKIFAGKRALDESIAAKQALLPTLEHDIRYNVHRAFHGVVGAREMLYTLSEGRKHLHKARTRLEENLERQEGRETEVDLIKLRVFEAQLDALEQEAIHLEQQALSALRFLVQANAGESFDIPEDPQTITEKSSKTLEEYLTDALNHRSELTALRHAINAHQANLEFQRAELLPDLALVASMRWGRTPGVTFRQNIGTETEPEYVSKIPYLYRNHHNYNSVVPAMALVMNYPLNFGQNAHRIRQAKAELQAIVFDQRAAVDGIATEVEIAFSSIETTRQAISALERSRRLIRGWLAAAMQNQATGIGSSKEVKDALKEYFSIMAQLHQKIATYNIGLAHMDKVTGTVRPPDYSE